MTIYTEAGRMSRLINDMLLSCADRHSYDIHPEEIEPDTLLLNAFEAFQPAAKEKNISMQIKLPEEAVPVCQCDGARLSQVLFILLHNAVTYSTAGCKITLSLHILVHPDLLCFTVADNGIGIPDEEKELIFQRFYRSEQSRSTKDHFGLGLSIAREIILAMKGSIYAEETLGGGASFIIKLPIPAN